MAATMVCQQTEFCNIFNKPYQRIDSLVYHQTMFGDIMVVASPQTILHQSLSNVI